MSTEEEIEARLDAFAAAGGFKLGPRGRPRRPSPHAGRMPDHLSYEVPLTADGRRVARLVLPTDLTLGEAGRIARFLDALVVSAEATAS